MRPRPGPVQRAQPGGAGTGAGPILQHAAAGVRRALDRLDDLEHGQRRGVDEDV